MIIDFPFPYESTSNKKVGISQTASRDAIVCFLNSSLQWLFYSVVFDTLNFKDYYIRALPFDASINCVGTSYVKLCAALMAGYKANAIDTSRGKTPTYEIKANLSKSIIDEIDELLAKHYGFTEEELDFIINYYIKYRMGDKLNERRNRGK